MSPMRSRAFDVIIPVHGQHLLAHAAIDSVLDGNAAAVARLIVIDDASPERFQPSISLGARRSVDLRLLRNERRTGFLAATERALSASHAPLVLVLNSDARLVPGLLDAVWQTRDAWDVVGFLAANAGEFSLPFAHPRPWDRILARHHKPLGSDRSCTERVLQGWIEDHPERLIIPTARFHGFCFAFSRPFIDGIGGLRGMSTASGRGFESDLAMRVRHAGGQVAVHLGHVLEHHGSASTTSRRRTLDLLSAAMRLRRHYPRPSLRDQRQVPWEILDLRRRCHEAGC
jgi:GT2 family glycosyltransferase